MAYMQILVLFGFAGLCLAQSDSECPITNAKALIANDNPNIAPRDGSGLIDLTLSGNPPVLAENSDVKERALIRFNSPQDISLIRFRSKFVHTFTVKINGNALPDISVANADDQAWQWITVDGPFTDVKKIEIIPTSNFGESGLKKVQACQSS